MPEPTTNSFSSQTRIRARRAWDNIRSTRTWQLQDLVNWQQLLKTVRPLSGDSSDSSMNVAALTFHLLTKMRLSYAPQEMRPPSSGVRLIHGEPASLAAAQRAINEPTVGHFVDAPDHLSGVATTLGNWARQASDYGKPLTMHYAGGRSLFRPSQPLPSMGEIDVGDYSGLSLKVPVVSEMEALFQRTPFDMVHLSTPGPVGLVALALARRHGLPVCATYHTDFPRYARLLSDDPGIEAVAWNYMRWFYGQVDRITAPTRQTQNDLMAHGMDRIPIDVVGRGVDTTAFHPNRRNEQLRQEWGPAPVKLGYVGRVSREKNLPLLVDTMQRLKQAGQPAQLVVVGDGPYRNEMEAALAGTDTVFCGQRTGADLARHYASFDTFVFPSETDTFGVVVVEALASGLPVVVSGQGGPRDIVRHGETGIMVESLSADSLAAALTHLVQSPGERRGMATAARADADRFTLRASFDAYWTANRLTWETFNDQPLCF